jgi:hypothetical protein
MPKQFYTAGPKKPAKHYYAPIKKPIKPSYYSKGIRSLTPKTIKPRADKQFDQQIKWAK